MLEVLKIVGLCIFIAAARTAVGLDAQELPSDVPSASSADYCSFVGHVAIMPTSFSKAESRDCIRIVRPRKLINDTAGVLRP